MARPIVIFRQENLASILQKESIITDILVDIMNDLNSIPEDITMLGIAMNATLGVFCIKKEESEYKCYRICPDKHGNGLLIGEVGYPVTNLNNVESLPDNIIECNMDYLLSVRTLRNMKQEEVKGVI